MPRRAAPQAEQPGQVAQQAGRPVRPQGTTLCRTDGPDHIVDHVPGIRTGCGSPLSGSDVVGVSGARQVFDLPELQPLEVTVNGGGIMLHADSVAIELKGSPGCLRWAGVTAR